MKTAALVTQALLFGSIALAAQTAGQGRSSYGAARIESLDSANAVAMMTVNIGCPVSLRAQHRADGGLLNVDRRRTERPAQMIHLILSNPDSRRIISARVRVHGLSGKGRVTQALSGQSDPDADATFDVQLAQEEGKEASGDLRVPNMTAVLSIDLRFVTFADGTTRNFSEREACRVAPDPFMLIAGR